MNRPVVARSQEPIGSYIVGGAVALLLLCTCVSGFLTVHRVEPGTVGVKINFAAGSANKPNADRIPSGSFTFINPVTERLASYSIAQHTLSMVMRETANNKPEDDSVACQDMNGIRVNVDSSTLYRVDPDRAADLFLLRPNMPLVSDKDADIEDTVIRREVRNAITVACSQYRFDELYGSKRAGFGEAVATYLRPALEHTFILLDGVVIGEIHLGKEQADAIARRAVAEQESIQAAFLKVKAEQEALAAIAKAKGDAEAIRIINDQLAQSRSYLDYLYATKWNGELPTYVGGNTSPSVLLPQATRP